MSEFTDNILTAFDRASDKDIEDGLTWYESAKAFAQTLTPDNPATGAGIIAALSPMTSWPENMRKASMLVDTGSTYGLPANIAKAQRILNGESPLDVLKGLKVRAFYLNIMGVNSHEAVTIDRHAIDVAHGRVMSDAERSPWFGKRKNGELVQAYLNAARPIGITGAQLQAIVWVYWRRNVTPTFHGDA